MPMTPLAVALAAPAMGVFLLSMTAQSAPQADEERVRVEGKRVCSESGELLALQIAAPQGMGAGTVLTLRRPAGGWCEKQPARAPKET